MTPENESSAASSAPPISMADRVLERMAPVIAGPPRWQLKALLVAAIVQIALAVPWLLGSDPSGLLGNAYPSHLTRDGALGLVIGAAAIVVARRPHYSLPAFIAGACILAIQLSTGLIDGHFHRVVLWVETTHVPTVLIVVLLALVSRPERGWRASPPAADVSQGAEGESETEADSVASGSLSQPASLRLVPPASND